MIQLITYQERNKRTGRMETLVSHGVDMNTGKNVIISQDPPNEIGGVFDENYGWIIPDQPEK